MSHPKESWSTANCLLADTGSLVEARTSPHALCKQYMQYVKLPPDPIRLHLSLNASTYAHMQTTNHNPQPTPIQPHFDTCSSSH